MKSKQRKIPYLVLILLILLFMSACSSSSPGTSDLMANIKARSWPDPTPSMNETLKEGVNDFSWDLFLRSLDKDGNILISPTSVYLAMAMTMNGSKGDTLVGMRQALRLDDWEVTKANEEARNWIGLLRKETEKTSVSIANSIWIRPSYDVAKDFLQTNADYYDAGARAMDFSDPKAAETINQWVKDNTNDKIDKIVEEIDEDVMMYLINAVYFKSDWKEPFLTDDTKNGTFYGKVELLEVPFMNRTGEMKYVDGNGVQGVLLTYDDPAYEFFAFLPDQGMDLRTALKSWDAKQLVALIDQGKSSTVMLSMPKFEVRYESDLNTILTDMGMASAFDPSADFSAMSENGNKDLYISKVLHKTFARVDEKGTEAAAVTSVEMRLTSMPEVDASLTFDRPFLYGIWNNETNTPLFIGTMEDPING